MTPSVEHPDLYSIVVLGNMNPSIHHPLWYQLIGWLSEAEVQQANKAGSVVCLPPLAEFGVRPFRITCTQERWQIATHSKDYWEKILHIACGVFEKLDQTPVRAFGFNSACHRRTSLTDVGQHLANQLCKLDLGLPCEGRASGELTYRAHTRGRRLSVTLQPSPLGPMFVLLAFNAHYEVSELLSGQVQFSLAPLLTERYQPDMVWAEREAERLVTDLNRMGATHATCP